MGIVAFIINNQSKLDENNFLDSTLFLMGLSVFKEYKKRKPTKPIQEMIIKT